MSTRHRWIGDQEYVEGFLLFEFTKAALTGLTAQPWSVKHIGGTAEAARGFADAMVQALPMTKPTGKHDFGAKRKRKRLSRSTP